MDDFLFEVFTEFNKRITDEVFLMIQEDRALMKKYRQLLESGRSLQNINAAIGMAVRAQYGLEYTEGDVETAPRSVLIDTHQRFKAKRIYR